VEALSPLAIFFEGIRKDYRICTTHIGLFAALLEYWQRHEFRNPIEAYSYQIMPLAKISASTTYHKCLRDLHHYGYLRYEPSFKRNRPSRIFLISVEEKHLPKLDSSFSSKTYRG
jgi:hypothetical protein